MEQPRVEHRPPLRAVARLDVEAVRFLPEVLDKVRVELAHLPPPAALLALRLALPPRAHLLPHADEGQAVLDGAKRHLRVGRHDVLAAEAQRVARGEPLQHPRRLPTQLSILQRHPVGEEDLQPLGHVRTAEGLVPVRREVGCERLLVKELRELPLPDLAATPGAAALRLARLPLPLLSRLARLRVLLRGRRGGGDEAAARR